MLFWYLLATIGFLIGSATLFLYFLFKRSYRFWPDNGIHFEKPEFIYGSMKDSIKQTMSLDEQVARSYQEYKAKGHKFLGIYFFFKPFLVVLDNSLVKNVLTKDFDHFVDRGIYYDEENDPLSAHLFSLEGLKWKHLRQKLTPTFTSGKMKKMFHILVDCSENLKSCLNEQATKGEPILIKKHLMNYTIDVIGSCAFGIECNSFKNPNSDFARVGQKLFNPDSWDLAKVFISILSPKICKFFKMRVSNKEAEVFFGNLVRDTIEYRERNGLVRNDFMQLLMELKNKGKIDGDEELEELNDDTVGTRLTMNETLAQAVLFFIAGFETSSTAMTFCLYELSRNQEVQENTRKDIVRTLKKYDGKLTYDSIKEMQYMGRVVLESLRKHAPVATLQRIVTKDYPIPDTDITLKKTTEVFISIQGIHEDPQFYPEPEKFDPDRFTDENKATRPDYTFLPFGDGPRNCIGSRFGLMQIKVGLCQLLLNYKFSLCPKTPDPLVLDPQAFIRSAKGGIWLNAEKI